MEVIPESDTKQKEEVEEKAVALVERQPGEIQTNIEQISKDTTRASKVNSSFEDLSWGFCKLFTAIVSFLIFSFSFQSSLARQECLEHDQQIVALLSMVRHIEVRLKQQWQQSIGRSLSTLDDIIKQIEVKDLYYSKCICSKFNRLFKFTHAVFLFF